MVLVMLLVKLTLEMAKELAMVKAMVLDSLLGLLVMPRVTMLEMAKVQVMLMAMVLGMLLVKLLPLMEMLSMVLALGMVMAMEQGMQLDTQATHMPLETTELLGMPLVTELDMLLVKLMLGMTKVWELGMVKAMALDSLLGLPEMLRLLVPSVLAKVQDMPMAMAPGMLLVKLLLLLVKPSVLVD